MNNSCKQKKRYLIISSVHFFSFKIILEIKTEINTYTIMSQFNITQLAIILNNFISKFSKKYSALVQKTVPNTFVLLFI